MKEFIRKIMTGSRPVVISMVIYTIVCLVTVLSAWAIDLHRYDLGKTISAYVGYRRWTAALYFVCITIMLVLLMSYVHRLKMPLPKKLVYYVVFFSVWGCAIFPSNREWSRMVSNIHLKCAYTFMFSASFSFLLTALWAKRKAQRLFALAVFAYAIFFILALLVMKWRWFTGTIFFWENLCIYLVMIELFLERASDQKSHDSERNW